MVKDQKRTILSSVVCSAGLAVCFLTPTVNATTFNEAGANQLEQQTNTRTNRDEKRRLRNFYGEGDEQTRARVRRILYLALLKYRNNQPQPEPEPEQFQAQPVPELQPEPEQFQAQPVPELQPEPEQFQAQPVPEPEPEQFQAQPVPEPQPEPQPNLSGDNLVETQTGNCVVSDEALEMLAAVNRARAQGQNCGSKGYFPPAQALTTSCELTYAAQDHADDMAQNNYFNHNSLDGSSPFDRMDRAGYSGGYRSENIALGYKDVSSVMVGWIESDGHCRNLMNPEYTELGAGITGGSGSRYWVQNFGSRR